MHDRNLEAVINDPASTPAEVAAARAALGVEPDPYAMHEDTRKMLDTLKVKNLTDLNEAIYERHIATYGVRSSDWIVKEFRYWIPPDDSFLNLIGMTIHDWWLAVHRIAVAANRSDAEAYARRKMQGSARA